MKPAVDILYYPVSTFAELLGRPDDQIIYVMASTAVLFASFGLYYHRGTPFQRQLYSTITGLAIHYYVFGWSGLASLVTNVLSYLAIIAMPKAYSHIAIFFVSGFCLALAQAHR